MSTSRETPCIVDLHSFLLNVLYENCIKCFVTQRLWQTKELVYSIGGVILIKETEAVTQKSVPVPLCLLKYPACPSWN